ncbi:MAG: hypothetical protein E7070_09965 [Bacteroidales bacterium]|jgi:hypothetical protein|nr:hypothetical protein [Bacteroidales bacterium]
MKTNFFHLAVLMAAATCFTLTSCDKDDDKESKSVQYVDLGLPSGTLWATCNVGATNPEDAGDYFSWGETAPKDLYTWPNYKWNSAGEPPVLSKYCTEETQGTVDNLTELELADDAAYVNMGTDWCMPTAEQCRELINTSYTKSEWERVNGVYGRKITSLTNGNSIFIPAVGHHVGGTLAFNEGELMSGLYWSSTLIEDNSLNACYLALSSSSVGVPTDGGIRFLGRTIRAVRRK